MLSEQVSVGSVAKVVGDGEEPADDEVLGPSDGAFFTREEVEAAIQGDWGDSKWTQKKRF